MRWIWRGLVGLLVVVAVLGGAGYLWLAQSLPTVDGSFELRGLTAKAEIVRDRFGVPHIYAESEVDCLFALGFAHAQDRLWQMEMTRRLGAGRLAEVLGEKALESDRLMRALDLAGVAARNYAALDPASRDLIDAYVAGVNAQLDDSGQGLPPEFVLLRHRPEPWSAVDSLIWLKLMALDLSTNWQQEIFRLRLAKRLTAEQIREFYLPYGTGEPRGPAPGPGRAAGSSPTSLALGQLDGLPPEGLGSNNWAVSGALSVSGRPLLANDPHLRLQTPALWYFAHLNWPGHNLVGATLPGLPTVVLGHNDRIAWSLANTGTDVADVYIERSPADSPKSYETPEGPKPFAVRFEQIGVRDGIDVELELRSTRHGPVLNDAIADLDELTEPDQVLALAWTGLDDDDMTIRAGLKLATVADWDGFVDAMRDFRTPQQNVIYADVDGNIGFIAPGRVPLRRADNGIQGFRPAPGWDRAYDWQGDIPFEALPRAFNPPGGILLSANHKIVPDDYPYHLTFEWAHGYRARRIGALLGGRAKHTLDSFRAIQRDATSLMARELSPILLQAAPKSELGRRVKAMLAAWNGEMAINRPEPLIFEVWYRELTRLIYADEMGPLFAATWGGHARFMRYVFEGGGAAWCDDILTETPENCAQQVTHALDRAIEWLVQHYGEEPMRWRWGEAHRSRARHLPFSDVPYLARFFETGAQLPGDAYTVNAGPPAIAYSPAPFVVFHGPSMRAVYDLDDLERSRFMLSTGQSGNPLSEHYADFVARWAAGEYIEIRTRRDEVEIGALGTLTLVPTP